MKNLGQVRFRFRVNSDKIRYHAYQIDDRRWRSIDKVTMVPVDGMWCYEEG